jgi:alginate O-acetyltransferase complex protein AlgI
MLFNSPAFLGFFLVVFSLYWVLGNHSRQNVFLIAASYFFYGSWSWKFLLLLIFSTLFDYSCALAIEKTKQPPRRRLLLLASVAVNLTLLGIFKYAGFFSQQASNLLRGLGISAHLPVLTFILPVGLSFYTFQSLGYVIDVYRTKLPAVRCLRDYALYVAFFPQLVAGPIERASHMLGQYRRDRVFSASMLETGLMLLLWGLFKKMVIADNLAPYVNAVFREPAMYSGPAIMTAVVFFSFQIYCDFSGYSDCARGIARTLGIEIIANFNLPYVSRNAVEFWQRWHISLSRWFQDYLYFPLAMHFLRKGSIGKYWAHIISFVLIGFWHGANWTFVAFGLYWGLVIALYLSAGDRLATASAPALLRFIPARLRVAAGVITTFCIACFGWLYFVRTQ